MRSAFVLLALLLTPLIARGELTDKQRAMLTSITRDRVSTRWTELTTNQLAELRRKADAYLEDVRRFHLPGGLVTSVRFADTNRSEAAAYEALDKSAAWTGFHLAAVAFRYAVTRDTKNLQDIRQSLDGIETLLTVSGREGYVPCFAGRAQDPAYRKFYESFGGSDPKRAGLGRWAFPGSSNRTSLVWLGNSSRDNYAALNFGLATVHQFVRDQTILARVSTNVARILNRLIADQWRIDDGQGNVTFTTPLLSAALLRTGTIVDPKRYLPLYERHVQEILEVPGSGVCKYCERQDGAFAFANLLVLTRRETNQTRRIVFQDKCNQLWRDGGSHLNPWFAAAYVGAFDTTTDSIARATLQGVLYQYPMPPRWSRKVDLSHLPAKDVLVANDARWSKFALPLEDRAPAPFQWERSSFALAEGDDALIAHPGIDLLLPFWIARESNVIPSEDSVPAATSRPLPTAPRRATNAPAVSPPKKP